MPLDRYRAYLERLPQGLESYPETQQRPSGLRARLLEANARAHVDALPEALRPLVLEPLDSQWLSEVKVHALLLALGDVCFPTEVDFDAFSERTNRRVLGGPVYLMLFRLLGPQRVSRGASRRWEQFHRNSTLACQELTPTSGVYLLSAPPHHVPPAMIRGYGIGLRVALELSGGHAVDVSARVIDSERTEYVARWS